MPGAAVILTGTANRAYAGKLTVFVIVTCVVAAMGGLIFGYDVGITGGVATMKPFQERFFPSVIQKEKNRQDTSKYCTFDSISVTLFTSSLYLAALGSCLFATYFTSKYGRKNSMVLGGAFFCGGALLNGFAVSLWMLIVGRLLLGFGVGFTNQAVPLYLSEMAPSKYRGGLNIVFQLSITVGILVANVLNFFFSKMGSLGWRLSLGGAIVPALIVLIGAVILPDSPNSMIERGQVQEATKTLRKIRGVEDVSEEINQLVQATEAAKLLKNPWRNLCQQRFRPHLTMAVVIPAFQQLTGINVIMFYAPVLFQSIGFGSDVSLISAVVTGLVNVGATVVSIYGVDKWGRRFLFLEGGIQMLISQLSVAAAIGAKFGIDGNPGELPKWYGVVVVVFICAYVAAFAWSWGPLGWLVPSEIFPLEIRSAAQSITVSVNMMFTFLIAQIFLTMLCQMKFGLFILFAAFVVAMSVFVYLFLPETRGVASEDMNQLWTSHWFWSRFYGDEIAEEY